ncbi:MAG: hypothetical protein ACM3KE_05235 [Hyphomicrobiales bacterium]
MDDISAKLLEELGSGPQKADPPAGAAAGALQLEDLDRWRILLVEMVYQLNACFRDVQYWEGIRTEKDSFKQFAAALLQLAQVPAHDGIIRINRGASAHGKSGERPDYTVRIGEISVDTTIIAALIKRSGIRLKHLEGRVQKAYETLASEGIDSMLLRIPQDSPESLEALRVALRVLSCYRQAWEKAAPIAFVRSGKPIQLAPVLDERGQPDPNLTMVAAVNELPADTLQDWVRKVSTLMQRPEGVHLRRQAPNVFQAIFAIKSLREKLQKPPLEVNAHRRPAEEAASSSGPAYPGAGAAGSDAVGAPGPAIAGGGPGGPGLAVGPAAAASGAAGDASPSAGPPPPMDSAVFKDAMARFVKESYRGSAHEAAGIVQSLNLPAPNYSGLNADSLGRQLGQITGLLTAMQANPGSEQLMDAVLQRLQAGMDHLPPELLNDLVVDGNEIKLWEDGQERVVGKVEKRLAQTIDTAKDHAAARRKLRATTGDEPVYLSRDTASVSAYFDIPAEDMDAILKLFRGCFDGRGCFQKTLFEKRVPEFARYHKKIFQILWEFLKDMPRRGDRLPFLNSLQLMIKELRQPLQAVRILLSDFVGDPAQVSFPDRNAVMLSTQFLRTYNKEINIDIELTPEEILRIQTGLDGKVVNYASWKINNDHKRVLTKVVSIRKRLNSAFDPALAAMASMPARFLLALEREVHIFLALVGGKTAATILHSSLKVFGNPEAPFYVTEEGRSHLYALLQYLSVLVRGIGRVGSEIDLILLDQIKQCEKEYLKMSSDPRHASLVRRVFSWTEPAKKEIESRLKGVSPAGPPPDGSPKSLSSTNTIDL